MKTNFYMKQGGGGGGDGELSKRDNQQKANLSTAFIDIRASRWLRASVFMEFTTFVGEFFFRSGRNL